MQQLTFSYQIIRSNRKTIAIQITPAGDVVVRCPRRSSGKSIRDFVESKSAWVEKHLAAGKPVVSPLSEAELRRLTEEARRVIPGRVAEWASRLGVTWEKISIRTMVSRWGSCSSTGNLSFNCLLMLAPADVVDYVVVHELCHRKEMNHSSRFWAEVERACPDYRSHKRWLKENGPGLLTGIL